MVRANPLVLLRRLALIAALTGIVPAAVRHAYAHGSPSRLVPAIVEIGSLAVDPTNSRVLYAMGLFGLMRSPDAGRTWTVWGASRSSGQL